MLALKILIGLAALGLGVWLGLPGRYDQTLDDIERNMDIGARESRKVQRYFTPLAWVQRKLTARGQRTRPRHAFRLERPEDR